ncbi:MAG: hypothetical protein K6T90_10570 [Leptolyngbyaceae cyanobacterium HOT.MB2.61]|jgi:hypothetical protein|nr:hypothetical protein [Leptolyngbyaceae cyanobacterium HOT.MB2.61]
MPVIEAFRLAHDKGCILKVLLTEDTPIYWIENSHFISKPFGCLDDLVTFLKQLPSMRSPKQESCEFCVVYNRS